MPIMSESDILRIEPGMAGKTIPSGFADQNKEVEILGTAEADTPPVSWTKVKLLDNTVAPEGWVRSAHVDLKGVVPGGPIEKLKFANQCWVEAIFSDANPHYVAAVAEMRSATSSGQEAGELGPFSGPFRFTQAEWDAARAMPEFAADSFSGRDIADWRVQVVVFTLMTHRSEAAITAELNAITAGRRPSAAELYLAQIIGAKAAAVALTKEPKPTIKDAFDGVAAADQAKDRPLGETDFGKIIARYKEILETGLMKGEDAIDRIVARLDPVLATTKDNIIAAGTALLGAPVEDKTLDGANSQLPGSSDFGAMGTTFAEKAPVIMRRLLADFPQLRDFHAAGILGNIGRETGGFRLMQEVRPKKGRGGLGWLQWTGPRRVNFENFCQPPKPGTDTDEGNYTFMRHEFTKHEGEHDEAHGFGLFAQTTNLNDATEVFMSKVERPGVPALQERQDWARKALSAFQNPPAVGLGGGGTSGGGASAISAGPVLAKAVQLALAERERFAGGSTVRETQEPLRSRVLEYFKFVHRDGANPGTVPWSAAFISFVMNEAGGKNFPFSAGHATYILKGLANRLAKQVNAPVVYFDKNEMAPRVGDLIGFSNEPNVRNRSDMEGLLQLPPNKQFFASHTDLVIEVSSGKVKAIGGNVSQTINITTVKTSADGKIDPADKRFFLLRLNM